MSIRYLTNMALLLAAGFIVVITQAWAPGTVEWLAFAAGIVFTVIGTGALMWRGAAHRALNAGVAVLGILMIIESMLASGSTLIWLSFAGAVAVAGLAVAGLTVHELTTERVVHSLAPVHEHEREHAAV